MQQFMGVNNFVWWHGVVEDNKDPLKLGRCRVRIFGFHSENRNELSTESLPWAHPMQPITNPSISGIGRSPTGVLQGSHIFGFFRDGLDAQQPCMLGTFGGIPQIGPEDRGFNDPQLRYPLEESTFWNSTVGEQDTNRLARAEILDKTIVQTKKDIVHKEIPVANSTDTWEEPETSYDARYPYNHVFQSEIGHVIEIDDTPDAKRLHVYHAAGTFQEIHPDGAKVEKIVHDNYKLVLGSDYVHVTGNVNLIVGATAEGEDPKSNITILVRGNADLQVDGDANAFVGKDMYANVTGNMESNVEGIYSVDAKKEICLHSDSNVIVNTEKKLTMKAKEGIDILCPEGPVNIKGSPVNLN
tara:strand:+ start:3253 stop:4320 length:1068 start_codon:yes stop_codon:yes gene_type:complete